MIIIRGFGNELKEKCHKALKGSPGYINSEIAIVDDDDDSFMLVIGECNDNDLTNLTLSKAES